MPPLTGALLDRPLLSPVLAGALGRTPLLPPPSLVNTRELEELLARPPRVEELKSRRARCETHREQIEEQLTEARTALSAAADARVAAEDHAAALQRELDLVETCITTTDRASALPHLDMTLLYVGGRPAQIDHLHEVAESTGAALLYHDGGVKERGGLLPGLVSRADAVLFPVDCVSHAAMLTVKRLCRQTGKKFVPLRSAGLAPFCAALKHSALPAAEG
jgi:Uncharacterized protein conserved in bacteria (DUF2325)